MTNRENQFDQSLDDLAELVIRTGVNVQEGQEIIITAPIEAQSYVRKISRSAYAAGAGLVTTLFDDNLEYETRLKTSNEAYFDVVPSWLFDSLAQAYENGAARLSLSSQPPISFGVEMQAHHSRVNKAKSFASEAIGRVFSDSRTNWNISPFVSEAWANAVFPNDCVEVAVEKLWNIIFEITDVQQGEATRSWERRNKRLAELRDRLQALNLKQLWFHDGKTDLTVGLSPLHRWSGGKSISHSGVSFNSNIPTFEVFTAPDRFSVEGIVHFSRPFSVMGSLVSDAAVRFENGSVSEIFSGSGRRVLESLFETDDGSSRLGEVALVPNSSPVSKKNMIFFNTLIDENAASHIAFGRSFSKCLQNGASRATSKANESAVHVDCMIGNGEMNVDGVTISGNRFPLMVKGEFVI